MIVMTGNNGYVAAQSENLRQIMVRGASNQTQDSMLRILVDLQNSPIEFEYTAIKNLGKIL